MVGQKTGTVRRRNWNLDKIERFQRLLLAWYRKHKRLLPWRSRPTPYRVWIAEVMLQQTQVRTVLPYYNRFLERFPDIKTLAAASEDEVVRSWAGLGYYRRAHDLAAAARRIVEEWRGRFPRNIDDIRRLPGVGRYTAAALCSIAFHQAQPVVDGNVRRVIGRLHGIVNAPESYFWKEAESLLSREQPSDFNQALMELGALVCTPTRPRCDVCPVRILCSSGHRGSTPSANRRPGRAFEAIEIVVLILECQGEIVLGRNTEAEFIPGLWGLPTRILDRGRYRPLSAAQALARTILGYEPGLRACARVRHAITHRRILAHSYHAKIRTPRPPLADTTPFKWVLAEESASHLTSSLFRKCVAAAGVNIQPYRSGES